MGHRETSTSKREYEIRDALDESQSGAPAAGEAVRDLFSTDEIFRRISATADEEFSRSNRLLFLSGLAAGLSISLSFLASSAFTAAVGGTEPSEASKLIGYLLYPLGFLFVVMGRYQLFTENTLTPVTLVMTRIASIPLLLRVWGIVLIANVIGAAITSYVMATSGVLGPEAAEVAFIYGEHFMSLPWWDIFWKGVFAGWLVAGMVWLNHASRSTTARFLITFILIYTIAAADLAHCIVGASEVLYLVYHGMATFVDFFWNFLVPAVLGNTVGGVLLVAILNYAQTRNDRFADRDCGQLELTWKEWLFGQASGAPGVPLHGSSSKHGGEADEEGRTTLRPEPDEDDHILGHRDAPITLTHFGDYECPTSREIFIMAQRVMEHAEDEVRYVYRHLPLSRRHPHAEQAAIATEAAAEQGQFWNMHDRIFHHQDRLEEDDLYHYAEEAGLDMEQFRRDMERDEIRQRVMDDRASGMRSGVKHTTNLFINSERYHGPLDLEGVLEAIEGLNLPQAQT